MTGIRGYTTNPARQVTEAFEVIYQTRQKGLPICRDNIRVSVPVMDAFDGDWFGILVTPWMMSALLLPGSVSRLDAFQADATQRWTFPGGVYDFMTVQDETLGDYQTCSLLSPLPPFADHADAEAAALSAYRTFLSPPAPLQDQPARISRRALLRPIIAESTIYERT